MNATTIPAEVTAAERTLTITVRLPVAGAVIRPEDTAMVAEALREYAARRRNWADNGQQGFKGPKHAEARAGLRVQASAADLLAARIQP